MQTAWYFLHFKLLSFFYLYLTELILLMGRPLLLTTYHYSQTFLHPELGPHIIYEDLQS